MSYRNKIAGTGNDVWSIPLATHLQTVIPNETSRPDITIPQRRMLLEEKFRQRSGSLRVRPPIAGYNCFGHIFASRRTALYEANIEHILSEDGYGEIIDEAAFAIEDVVVYSDEVGPTHVARISRFNELQVLPTTANLIFGSARIPMVLSKIDDVSGEYEHAIDDFGAWTFDTKNITRRVYRERHNAPRKLDGGWRQRIVQLDTSANF